MAQKSLKKNIVLNMFRTLMTLVFPLITFPYSSHVLNPEGIGKVNFSGAIVSYFALFAGLGISSYAIRESSKLRDDREKLSHFSQEILLFHLMSTVITYIALFLSIFFIPKFFEYRALMIVQSSTILFTFLGVDWLYTALEDFTYITIRSFIFQVISLIALFIFVRDDQDYLQYAAISVFANVGSNICNIIHSRKFIDFKITSSLNIKQHVKPIFIIFALVITSSIYNVLDTAMVGLLANDYHVGLYSAATKVNRIVLSMVVSVGGVLLPRLSYYAGNNKKQEFDNLAYKYLDCVLLLAFPSAVGLTLLAEPIIYLLSGDKFMEAVPAMRIMNPLLVVMGISNLLGVQVFFPLKKEKWTLYSDICGAIVNLSLNMILIPKLYSLGAAIGTIVAETCVTLVQVILARKIINVKIILKSFFKYFIFSTIMAIPVFICTILIKNILLNLVVSIFVGISMYFITLIVTKNELLLDLLSVVKKRFTRR